MGSHESSPDEDTLLEIERLFEEMREDALQLLRSDEPVLTGADGLPRQAALRAWIEELKRRPAAPALDPTRGTTPLDPLPRIGEYRLVRRLGEGGMGVVYVAQSEASGQRVALKIVRAERMLFTADRERFAREVEAIARLAHPSIVAILDVAVTAEVPHFAMELVPGVSLSCVLDEVQGMDPERLEGVDLQALAALATARVPELTSPSSAGPMRVFDGSWMDCCVAIAKEVADALAHIHGHGLVHRDVKPSNVLLTPAGRVVLVDFGLAWDRRVSRVTVTGLQVGSLPYLAPELLGDQRREPDARTDVYSLGVMLYELLGLRLPFHGETVEELRKNALAARCARLGWFRRCPRLERVCLKALDPSPKQRYADAAELARDLERILEHQPVEARRPGGWTQVSRWVQRHPQPVLALLAVAPLLLGATVFENLRVVSAAARDRSAFLRAEAHRRAGEDPGGALALAILTQEEDPALEGRTVLVRCLQRLVEERTLHVNAGPVPFAAFVTPDTILAIAADGDTSLWSWEEGEVLERTDVGAVLGRPIALPGAAALARLVDGSLVQIRHDSGLHERELPIPEPDLEPVLGSPAGDALLVRNAAQELLVLSLPAGTLRCKIPASRSGAMTGWSGALDRASPWASFSPDSRRLALADGDAARVFDLGSGAEVRLECPEGSVRGVAFDPSGETLAMTSSAGTAFLWKVDTQGPPIELKGHDDEVLRARFSPDGRRVVTCGFDRRALVFDARSGIFQHELGPHGGEVWEVAFDPRSPRAVTLSGEERARLWDLETGELVPLFGHTRAVLSAAFSAGGERIVTSAEDGTVRIWKCPSAAAPRPLVLAAARSETWSRMGHDIEGSPHPERLGRALWRVLDLGLDLPALYGARIPAAAIAPSDLRALTVGEDRPSVLWDLRTHATIESWDAPTTRAAFSPDGARLATIEDGVLCLRSARGGARLECERPELGVHDVSLGWRPDGSAVAVGRSDGGIDLVEADGRSRRELGASGSAAEVVFLAFGRDADELVAASDGVLVVLDGKSGVERARLDRLEAGPICADLDGRGLLAAALWDRTLHLWRVADGSLHESALLDAPAAFLRFTDDGPDGPAVEYLTTCGRWGRVPVDPLAEARRRAPRELAREERERYGLDR